MSLQGKTLFISGGSRGIGLAIALRAARDGANVAIAAKTVEPNPALPGTIHSAAAETNTVTGRHIVSESLGETELLGKLVRIDGQCVKIS